MPVAVEESDCTARAKHGIESNYVGACLHARKDGRLLIGQTHVCLLLDCPAHRPFGLPLAPGPLRLPPAGPAERCFTLRALHFHDSLDGAFLDLGLGEGNPGGNELARFRLVAAVLGINNL